MSPVISLFLFYPKAEVERRPLVSHLLPGRPPPPSMTIPFKEEPRRNSTINICSCGRKHGLQRAGTSAGKMNGPRRPTGAISGTTHRCLGSLLKNFFVFLLLEDGAPSLEQGVAAENAPKVSAKIAKRRQKQPRSSVPGVSPNIR